MNSNIISTEDEAGDLHSIEDNPAYINNISGVNEWHSHGNLHRNNDKYAYINIYKNIRKWYKNDQLHRDNDEPAYIDDNNGIRKWYKNDQLHRDGNKPAIIHKNGIKEWWENDLRHRINGPAIKLNGNLWGMSPFDEWYVNGIKYDEEAYIHACYEYRSAQPGYSTKGIN